MSTAGPIDGTALRQVSATVAQALLSLLLALALVMLVRRLSGAFVQPLSGTAIVAAAAGLAIVAALVRLLIVGRFERTPYLVLSALPGVAVILLLAALTLSGTPAVAIAIAWFVVVAGEGASWLVALRPELVKRERPRQRVVASQIAPDENIAEPEPELPAGLVQQLTRVREENRESIHALLLAEIPVGDGQVAIHVAFCPPLESAPELTAHALDAEDAEVRITQAETFGARIEVRVAAASAEQRSVVVEVLGTATCR